MTYALARQLKNAGFPDMNRGGFWNVESPDGLDRMYAPTLSELIEACGEELDEIVIYITDGVVEVKGSNPTYGLDLNVKASTPEEAVALLWLELNK